MANLSLVCPRSTELSNMYVSKWFYDTSTSTATRADRCGLFVGEGLGLSGVSYRGTQWRRGFMRFRPPECNTLRPRENWCVVLLSAV
jgi:hypothetical protein